MFHTLSYQCTVLYRDFWAYTSRRLEQLGLNYGVLFLLIYIGKHEQCTQAELTNALQLDWGYCQRSVLKLVEEGFVLRVKQGRAYHLSLSELGRQAFEVSHQVFFDWDREALHSLTAEEQQQLLTLLGKIKRK
ncbi:MAG: bilirubin utilization transcriptional regulator BilQ [Eubacteriales bacterium]|jgi:DNA-binding MarR family transcriptional regulator